eukprot:TRINITY_DN31376_c0_g1_i1.p1 TRINITY_DN31376_c0_g1~~TRINITY_DN31376_c0_g1_i1.p1  ORF type:complete len:374 (-),score=55.32 TRINITY_DN31376_c0_g1_i1:129-1250(-)
MSAGEDVITKSSAPIERQRQVEIPMTVLTAADCDPALREPPPQDVTLLERVLEFQVPPGSVPGCRLELMLGDEKLTVVMPDLAVEGDWLCVRQRSDGSWRVGRKATSFGFALPEWAPGEKHSLPGPDGNHLGFVVPEGLDPGDVMIFRREGQNPWSFHSAEKLPEFNESPPLLKTVAGPYVAILELLENRGILGKLPVDEDGILQVSIPFCGRFHEHGVLANFLSKQCSSLEGVVGANILATEVIDSYSLDWAVASRWCKRMHSDVTLETSVHDLSADSLPEASLVVGIHPEVTKGGGWFRIIGSILQSGRKGLCLFTTFFDFEMKTLLNMVDMYKEEDAIVEVVENPYYDNHEKPQFPPMRYLVLVSNSQVA